MCTLQKQHTMICTYIAIHTAHACAHTRHTHTHTYTHTHISTRVYASVRIYNVSKFKRILKYMYTYIYPRKVRDDTDTHTRTLPHTYAHAHRHTTMSRHATYRPATPLNRKTFPLEFDRKSLKLKLNNMYRAKKSYMPSSHPCN